MVTKVDQIPFQGDSDQKLSSKLSIMLQTARGQPEVNKSQQHSTTA